MEANSGDAEVKSTGKLKAGQTKKKTAPKTRLLLVVDGDPTLSVSPRSSPCGSPRSKKGLKKKKQPAVRESSLTFMSLLGANTPAGSDDDARSNASDGSRPGSVWSGSTKKSAASKKTACSKKTVASKASAKSSVSRKVRPKKKLVGNRSKQALPAAQTAQNAAVGSENRRADRSDTEGVTNIDEAAKLTPENLKKLFCANSTAIIVVCFQKDFMEGGPMGTPGADSAKFAGGLTDFIQSTRTQKNLTIVHMQDYHPPGHKSFASSHAAGDSSSAIGSIKILKRGRGDDEYEQILWPDHAVADTKGAQLLVPALENEIVIQAGTHKDYDTYSAFYDDGDLSTGLHDRLLERGIKSLVICGLAGDEGVLFTLADAVLLGYSTYAVTDLVRCVQGFFDIEQEYHAVGCKTIWLQEYFHLMQSLSVPKVSPRE